MKNLRRVLSLALSGIMLVGMMAMSASAVNAEDFTDAGEITHTEAVSIATALKIIDGKDDGSFDPNGSVTRGQMAKMITRAMFGGEDPVLGLPNTPSFTDIKGRWDETYIEYCANNGIINGRGDGTFDPEGNVTGTEAAKMLLTALGYKADIYGLVGPDWAITTNSIANQTRINLYGGLKGLDPTQPFTRDQVAQMVYNTLNANTREMNPNMEITGNGDITYQYVDSGRTLLYDKYGAIRVEGVVEENEYSNNAETQKGKTRIVTTNDDEIANNLNNRATVTAGDYTANFAVSSGREEYGRAVILYVKPANSTPGNLARATVISDVIVDAENNNVLTTTSGFNGAATKELGAYAKDNGLKLTADTKYVNNYAVVDDKGTEKALTAAFGADPSKYAAKRGTEVIVIDNDVDGDVDYVLKNDYAFGQVTKYSTKGDGSVTIRTNGGIKLAPSNAELADVVAYEGIAQDDYVNVTKVSDTYYVTKSEVVEGDLTAYENETENYKDVTTYVKSMSVDDEAYKTNQVTKAYTAGGLRVLEDIAKDSVLDEAVEVYLDQFGYAVAGNTKAAADWLFVANAAMNDQATGLSSATLTAFVYMEDGTSGSYVIDEYSVTDAAGKVTVKDRFDMTGKDTFTGEILGKLFKYSVKSNGHLILEAPDTTKASITADDSKTQNGITFMGDNANQDIIDYNKDLSKLTLTDVQADPKDNKEYVKYVTMDTVVFFVTLKANDKGDATTAIDKVQVYDQKNAPSMNYKAAKAAGLYDKGFQAGVAFATSEGSQYNLDAVAFVNTKAVASDWVYLIDYVRTVSDGRIYNAIVNDEVVQITTNDKKVRATPSAYGYAMDGSLYALDNTAYGLAYTGEVTLSDGKSVIIKNPANPNGVEARYTKSTVTALLDGKDTVVDVSINVGDIVTLIVNDDSSKPDAVAVFTIAEYDDTKSAVVETRDNVSYDSTTKTYTVTLDSAVLGKTGAVKALKDSIVTSGKASMKLLASTADPKKYDDIKKDTEKVDADVKVDAEFKLAIISESLEKLDDTAATTGYTVINVKVSDGLTPASATFALKAPTADDDNTISTSGTAVTVNLKSDQTGCTITATPANSATVDTATITVTGDGSPTATVSGNDIAVANITTGKTYTFKVTIKATADTERDTEYSFSITVA